MSVLGVAVVHRALPLRNYVPLDAAAPLVNDQAACCLEQITRAEPDDDVNYSVLALMMLEQFGKNLMTKDVALTWLRQLPLAATFTAERAAYLCSLPKVMNGFQNVANPVSI